MKAVRHKANDRWIFIIAYPLIAFIAVHLGNDNSFQELIRIPSYYSDILFALITTYSIGFYLRYLYRRLDVKYDWSIYSWSKLSAQLIEGVMLPTLVIIVLEGLYLIYLLEIPILESTILYLELPLTILFLVILNLLHTAIYYRSVMTKFSIELEKQEKIKSESLSYFIVHTGAESHKIAKSEVAYFIIKNKVTFLITHDGMSYFYDISLDRLITKISPIEFFKLNRQVIVHRKAIISYERLDSRKLQIRLAPESSTPIFVAKTKVSEFNKWLEYKKGPLEP